MGRRLPVFLHGAEPEALLAQAKSARDRLIVQLGLLMGLRVSEICKLRVEDLDLEARIALIARAKGDKDRLLPLPLKLVEPLGDWIGERTEGWVFPSPRKAGEHLTTRAVHYLVVDSARRAGIRRHIS